MRPIVMVQNIIISHWYYKKKIEEKESKKSKFVLYNVGMEDGSKRPVNVDETGNGYSETQKSKRKINLILNKI